jgi:hypothetical protein
VAIRLVVTRGYGSFGNIAKVVTRGYGSASLGGGGNSVRIPPWLKRRRIVTKLR